MNNKRKNPNQKQDATIKGEKMTFGATPELIAKWQEEDGG